jgi:hypothetical protein
VSIQLIALLEELYKESRGGALDGPVRKSSAATDERASLKGEYEKFLIPQTPSDVISTYPLVTQQGSRAETKTLTSTTYQPLSYARNSST